MDQRATASAMFFNDFDTTARHQDQHQDQMTFDSPTSDGVYPGVENPRILPNGLMEERVRVDRKLYDKLLGSDSFSGCSPFGGSLVADDFFQSIMVSTQTVITWPSRLRLNTRSRKDPHIKIVGTEAGVSEAKGIINLLLDTRINRVTLKMDVAFTDHSHVIGKGGRSIQKVMDSTGCHIHFPDSNRSNSMDKSNQVSIAGSAQGAEQARCRVRELLPVSVHYEIPLSVIVPTAMDPSSGTLQSLQRDYGLNISFKPVTPFRGSYEFGVHVAAVHVTIRGSRALVISLRRGISLLLEYLTAGVFELSKTPALIETEIAAQHHAFVMGRGNCNIRSIVQTTGAIVSFPEATVPYFNVMAPTASSLPNKRSNVKIKGANFDCAFNGWLELMGYLPLLLIFDLPDGRECDAGLITQMMDQLKVSILIKPKQKQSTKSVMVRGPERESRTLFEVRRQILDLDHSEVPFCCEQHYWAAHYSSLTPASTAMHQRDSNPGPGIEGQTLRRTPGSTSSLVDSRARLRTETSLTSILNQQRDSLDRRRVRRLDTYDSTSGDDEYRTLCRSVMDNCSLADLNESFKADQVFDSSLSQEQTKCWPPTFKKAAQDEDVAEATSPTDFGSILSQTFPTHSMRKDNFSNWGRGRDADSDCGIA